MPLALPYPFRTLPGSGMGAERDKREIAKNLYFGEVLSSLRLHLDVCLQSVIIAKIDIISEL